MSMLDLYRQGKHWQGVTLGSVVSCHQSTNVLENGRVIPISEIVYKDLRDDKANLTILDFSLQNLIATGNAVNMQPCSLTGNNIDGVSNLANNALNAIQNAKSAEAPKEDK